MVTTIPASNSGGGSDSSDPTPPTVTTHTESGTAVIGYNEIDASAGDVTITMPTAVAITGEEFDLKRIDDTANTVTINTTSSQTIDGSLTKSLVSQYEDLTVYSNGSNYGVK